jgi:hypothetical protein
VEAMTMKDEQLLQAASALGICVHAGQDALQRLWDVAFEQGKLAALGELQDRFCVCMK